MKRTKKERDSSLYYSSMLSLKGDKKMWNPLVCSLKPLSSLCLKLPLASLCLVLCNWSSSAHFKPKHVCLVPKRTWPPLSFSFVPSPIRPRFKSRGMMSCRCLKRRGAQDEVWGVDGGQSGEEGSWEWVVMSSDYSLTAVISHRRTRRLFIRNTEEVHFKKLWFHLILKYT